jgi:hypothetical protein
MLSRKTQVLVWQMSVLYLISSVVSMLGGMFILIWTSTGGTGDSVVRQRAGGMLMRNLQLRFINRCIIFCLFLVEKVAIHSKTRQSDNGD